MLEKMLYIQILNLKDKIDKKEEMLKEKRERTSEKTE